MIRFHVPAVPVAQPRQRHRVLTAAGRTFAHNFTPAKHPVQAFKATVRLAFQTTVQPHETALAIGPVGLYLTFVLPRPKSLTWKKRAMPRLWHTSKPDTDNLAKAVKDALTGLAWKDDSQVCFVEARKLYAAGDESPGVLVEIETLGAWSPTDAD